MTTNDLTPSGLPPAWSVQLPVFEGPLDLLLHLVRVNQVEITEIPVATICDQFHETLRLMEVLNLDIAAEYIYEAAQLIYLKSRMLLPSRRTEDGDEADDPRQELVTRLLEYRRLKDAAQSFAEVHSRRREIWPTPRRAVPDSVAEEAAVDLGDVSLWDLLGALKTVLVRYDYEHPDPIHLAGERFSVRGQVEKYLDSLSSERPLDLLADLRARGSRSEVVAAFLAVLELVRLALVRLHQTAGGEILLYRTEEALAESDLEALEP